MDYKIRISPIAKANIKKAVSYYKNFRGLPLKKFPYIIFFQVDEIRKLISINAVFQGNQDIDKRP